MPKLGEPLLSQLYAGFFILTGYFCQVLSVGSPRAPLERPLFAVCRK